MSAEAGERYAGWTYIAAACVLTGVLIISASAGASAGTVSLMVVVFGPLLFGLAALWERSRGREYQVTERDQRWIRWLNWLFVVASVTSLVLSWLLSR